VQFTIAVAMTDPTHYTALARTAEECGFAQVAVPDSSFWSEQASDAYPYTADGGRMWNEQTPFVEPFMAVAAMAAATERIRFCTHVVKVGVRNPLLLAKQVASAAVLSGDRFTFGAGVGWLQEEFEWCGQAYEGRGKRVDESLDAICKVLTGEWTSYDGEHVRFGRLRMPPSPRQKVPVYIGGHTPVALRRTVRFGDGWTSAMIGFDDFRSVHAELTAMLQAAGRATDGFVFQVASADRYGLEGYRELAAAGATDVVTVPWLFYGVPLDADLPSKQDGIRQFAADVLDKW
jgi:probable F420-dependent oxidoreductase